MSAGEVPAPATVAALRSAAARATSTAVERGVGVLLGADPGAARSAVAALEAAGRVGDGLALCALVLAARRGLDAAAAVAELAGGRPLPEGWSDFEVRAAHEEAVEEQVVGLRPPSPGGPLVVAAGADAPVDVALALRAGSGAGVAVGAATAHLADGLTLLRAVVDHAWAGALAGAAGWPVRLRGGDPGAAALDRVLGGGGDAALPPASGSGEHGVWWRGPAHLRLLPAPDGRNPAGA